MSRSELKTQITNKLNAGLSVHLAGLPSWGATRWLTDLELPKRKLVRLDTNLTPFKLPEETSIDDKLPTTFVIDHFDALIEDLKLKTGLSAEALAKAGNSQLFNHLRSIRDLRKYHVTYLIVTNKYHDLSPYSQLLGSFYELATESKFYFPACDPAETNQVIDNIVSKFKLAIKEGQRDSVYEFSGGIAGLIKSWLLEGEEQVQDSSRVKGMLTTVWQAMSDKQRQNLVQLVKNEAEEIDNELIAWKVVADRDNPSNNILSSALKQFIENQSLEPTQAPETPRDPIENNLTKIEHRLFKCLKSNLGQVSERDDLIAAGWPDDNPEGVSEEALDQAVSRLRKKLADTNYQLKTVKGRGYLLGSN